MSRLFVNTDMVLTLKGLKDKDGVAVTGATVTVTLLDGTSEVTGATWPMAMTHVEGGDYEADLPKDLGLTLGNRITAKFTAASDGKQSEFIHRAIVASNTIT